MLQPEAPLNQNKQSAPFCLDQHDSDVGSSTADTAKWDAGDS